MNKIIFNKKNLGSHSEINGDRTNKRNFIKRIVEFYLIKNAVSVLQDKYKCFNKVYGLRM